MILCVLFATCEAVRLSYLFTFSRNIYILKNILHKCFRLWVTGKRWPNPKTLIMFYCEKTPESNLTASDLTVVTCWAERTHRKPRSNNQQFTKSIGLSSVTVILLTVFTRTICLYLHPDRLNLTTDLDRQPRGAHITTGYHVWRRGSNSAATTTWAGEEACRASAGWCTCTGEQPCSREEDPLLQGSGPDGVRGLRQSQAAGEDAERAAAEGWRGPGARQGVRAELRRADGQTGAVRTAASPACHDGNGGLRGHWSSRGGCGGPESE